MHGICTWHDSVMCSTQFRQTFWHYSSVVLNTDVHQVSRHVVGIIRKGKMRTLNYQKLIKTIAIAAALTTAPLLSAAQRTDDDIVIGQTLDLSGPQAVSGKDIRAGVEARIRQANKNGDIAGHKLVLEVMDDKFNPKLAADNAGKALLVPSAPPAVASTRWVSTPIRRASSASRAARLG